MKQILLLCLVALTFASCEDKKSGKLDPNSNVYIVPAPGVKSQTNPAHLSALEIVKQTNAMYSTVGAMGIDEWNRDITNIRLIGSASWVIEPRDGSLVTELIKARDYILVTNSSPGVPKDTIAYLPNAVMAAAEKAITEAYNAEDYAACYVLFEQAFQFYPITGVEWRELKAKNEN